jgi:hypothetical protein
LIVLYEFGSILQFREILKAFSLRNDNEIPFKGIVLRTSKE